MGTRSLFIGNLATHITASDLQRHFSTFEPEAINLVPLRRQAYLDVPTHLLQPAIDALDGSELDGHTITVRAATFRELSTSPEESCLPQESPTSGLRLDQSTLIPG